MSTGIVASEEIRDVIGLDGPATVARLADTLAVGLTTVRRHLRLLEQRGHVQSTTTGRTVTWSLTPRGRRAYDENEAL